MFMRETELLGDAEELDQLKGQVRGNKQDRCSLKSAANLLHCGSMFRLHRCSCKSMQETELLGPADTCTAGVPGHKQCRHGRALHDRRPLHDRGSLLLKFFHQLICHSLSQLITNSLVNGFPCRRLSCLRALRSLRSWSGRSEAAPADCHMTGGL